MPSVSMNDLSLAGSGYGWMLDGECVHYPTELFFPEPGHRSVRALVVCASCSVKAECLAFGLAHSEHGVWGGMSEKQRAIYKQELRDAQKQAHKAEGP